MKWKGYLNFRSHGNDQEYAECQLGVLFFCVCDAMGEKDGSWIMVYILDEFSAQGKASSRLRQATDLRNCPEDLSQRILNALEPGTILPIHRHQASFETVVILRGKIEWVFFDENGQETERVVLDANGEPRMQNVEKDR